VRGKGVFIIVKEGRQVTEKVEMAQVWAQQDDGAQDGSVSALLELDREAAGGSGPGKQAERCAHARLRALAKDHRIHVLSDVQGGLL
jgi:hypothetical protein